ncbi:hypothetical protein JCM10212_002688 [Sporobolomyces blumeae]
MWADDNFSQLCPDLTIKDWCNAPSSEGVCCGICPSAGISGLGGHVSLAFSSFASIAAIAMSPASAPSALVTNLIQANAYALSLLGYLLTNTEELDFFHAAYALLLALSSLIPLTAIAASPPWAVTGQKSPQERAQEAEQIVMSVLGDLEGGGGGSRASSDEKRSLRQRRRRLRRALRDEPDLFLDELDAGGARGFCGIPGSHWMLYLGFGVSILLWGTTLMLGVLGGATNSSRVSLAQPNCTAGLGSAASLIIYTDIGFMMLGVVVFIATILNHLASQGCRDNVRLSPWQFNRESLLQYNGSPRLVFGASFTVWIVWMIASFTVYFQAANSNLLAAGEFGWSFGTTFSILMNTLPIYSILKTVWNNR